MADRKLRFALLSRYDKLCREYDYKPLPMNKNMEQWSADGLIESFGLQECYDLLDYYFSIRSTPSWRGFANGADRLLQSKIAQEEDDRLRAERRAKAKEWLNG
jgi:hypothetical protein